MERLSGEPKRSVYRLDTIDLERAVCQGAAERHARDP